MPSLCLHMIVKNEAAVIRRCLESVKPFIAAWVIADTGSTDGTQEIIRETMAGIPGALVQREWVNFAANRTDAMALARTHGTDYLLTIDADETFKAPEGWVMPELGADAYEVRVQFDERGDQVFTRSLVTRASVPFRYEGAVHEDIAADVSFTRGGVLPDVYVLTTRDGAREKNPSKYLDDAELLRREMSRSQFYLAQSLRDHWVRTRQQDALEQALVEYERRAGMPGWDQETWAATFEVARCKELLEHPRQEVIEAYLKAHALRPSRAESLSNLARYLRGLGHQEEAKVFEDAARVIPLTSDSMYVDRRAYEGRDVRIGIITAPRVGLNALHFTLVSVLGADTVPFSGVRVFSDSVTSPPCSVPVETEDESELARRREVGGIYGSLNLARALEWAGQAQDVAVTLEDDVLCSRGWLRRGVALLEAAEMLLQRPVVVSLHDMHGRDAFAPEPAVRAGEDSLLSATERTYPNGSQGYMMRPQVACMLAHQLRLRMDSDDRKLWAMDVGMQRLCNEVGLATMLFAEPCLLLHIDGARSTWASQDERWLGDDEAHRACRKTRRFRPW